MRWGKALLVVVVALVGAQLLGLARPARAVSTPPPPKLYSYSYDHTAGTLTGSGANDGSGIRAGSSLAFGRLGGSMGSAFLAIGEDIGGYRVIRSQLSDFFVPFGDDWKGGVTVAVGDLDGVSGDEFVTAQETGGSLIRTFPSDASGNAQPLASFKAYEDDFKGGVRVAVGDVDGDGTNEIIVAPGPGRAPTVKVFSASGTLLSSADVYASTFTGGVYVAAANLDGDVASEIVTGAGAGGATHVRIYNGLANPVGAGFIAYDTSLTNGVRVAAGTLDGQPIIATTTRTDDGAVARLFHSDGTAATAQTAVAGTTGDLSVAISAAGGLAMFDAAPRLAGVNPEQLHQHTRNFVTLYGAGLSELFDDISVGDEQHPAFVVAVIDDGQDLQVVIRVPADTPAGAVPLTLSVKTPGGTQTHNLHANSLSVVASTPALHAFVTTGVGSGGGPHVRTYSDGRVLSSGFMAGDPSRASGVRVARADFNGDGRDGYAVSYGPGSSPRVAVYNQDQQLVNSFDAYDPSFQGGVYVAVGDLDGDGIPEIVTGADSGGGPHVKIFDVDGNELGGFMAYDPVFHGGVRVAVGDVDGDSFADIITAPGPGGGPHVRAWHPDGNEIGGFMAYASNFTGGVFVAAADVDGDAVDEIVTGPGAGGGPHVRIFTPDGAEVGGFMAFAPNFTGGVSVGRSGDDIAGPDDIAVGAGPGGGPHVKILDADGNELDGFMAYDPNFHGGVFVAGGIA
jgi:hypothetical protein